LPRPIESQADDTPKVVLPLAAAPEVGPPCPVDHLSRRRRNQICIAVIAVGLLNYMVYTLTYAAIGGDAHNGYREEVVDEASVSSSTYYVRGHFIHSLSGRERAVSRATWIYSYLHSITVPITFGAVIVSVLILARPHIIATMRGGLVSGQTFITAFATVVILIASAATVLFVWDFVAELTH